MACALQHGRQSRAKCLTTYSHRSSHSQFLLFSPLPTLSCPPNRANFAPDDHNRSPISQPSRSLDQSPHTNALQPHRPCPTTSKIRNTACSSLHPEMILSLTIGRDCKRRWMGLRLPCSAILRLPRFRRISTWTTMNGPERTMPSTTVLGATFFIGGSMTRAWRRSLATGKLKKRHKLTEGRCSTVRSQTQLQRSLSQADLGYASSMANDNAVHSGTHTEINPDLVCNHPKCSSKVFKRKGDLTRHKLLHEEKREFSCMAQECNRKFTRNDKLMDHIRAGHEAEELFACTNPRCSMLLTRDVLPLHRHSRFQTLADYYSLSRNRQCPLPRCSFRTRTSSSGLDRLRGHLLKDHDPKGRKMYASLLASRGYDHESANIVCPICTEGTAFNEHREFGFHFLEMHCPNLSAVSSDPRCDPQICRALEGRVFLWLWEQQKWGTITNEQRKHRRTILSLLPVFGDHPVWNDIRYDC
jgi:hypothetical protein